MITPDEKILQKFLSDNYGLSVETLASPSEKPQSSFVFVASLSHGGKVLLKASNWYSGFAADPTKTLEKVYEVAASLKELGAPLQTALKNISGRYTTSFDQKPWVVLDFVEGALFSGRKEEWVAAGRALGQFHRVGLEFLKANPKERKKIRELIPVEKPYEESRDLYQKGLRGLLLAPHNCRHKDICATVSDNISILDEAIKSVDKDFGQPDFITEGILHNDFNYANGLYKPDGSFAGFLDIDQLSIGPLVWDIGNTLASLATKFLLKKPADEREEAIQLFLFAYHRENPLLLSEYELITASTLRWDVMRILRTLRRHHFENDRLPELMSKITGRFLARLQWTPNFFSFITIIWLKKNVT